MPTKFRAWNKVEKKYYYKSLDFVMWNLGEDVTCSELGMTAEEYMEKQNWIGFDDLDKLYWVFEQYTGVNDKNGVEICEGDIGKDEFGTRFKVVFKDGAFMLLGGGEYTDIKYAPVFMMFEVTGNVHEDTTK